MASQQPLEIDYSKYDFKDPELYVYKSKPGLSEQVVEEISRQKDEPDWLRRFRLKSLETFLRKPMPLWGADLKNVDFDRIHYYIKPSDRKARSWDDVPEYIKKTFDRLGIPEAERKFLAGVGAQYESEVVYHNLQKELEKKGVIFVDPDTAFKEYADIFKPYFGKVVPPEDNKFAALNSAVFSGGSFIYVPEGVEVQYPLQAYFRINAANVGQFERTLIIAEPYSRVHYIEGCLPGDEKVSTGQLTVEISSIQPDDVVVNGRGEHTLVRALRTRHYEGELVVIQPISPANSFQLTPDHPVLAVKRDDVVVRRSRRSGLLPEVSTEKLLRTSPKYIPAKELRRGDFLVFPINKEVEDDPRYTPQLLKLIGYYLAEGSAFIHNKLKVPVVEFSLGAHEKELAAEIIQLVTEVTGKKPSVIMDRAKNGLVIVSHSEELMKTLLESCGKGSSEKKLSKKIMLLPPQKQRILLEAYFRGDGSVYSKGRLMVRASTASEKLAYQLQELLARQNMYASIMVRRGSVDTINGRKIKRKTQYVLYYSLNKKWNAVRKTSDYFLVPIRSVIKKRFKGKVYNIEVCDDSQSYLVKGFAVHNCTAPIYSTSSLHTAVVEIIAKKGAYVRYTTLQNWSSDVYNLVTKRAHAYEEATVEWVDANIGCLDPDTLVYMNNDIKRIRDVEVGDTVYTLGSDLKIKSSKVVGKKVNPPRPVYRLVTANYRQVIATDNHPFLLLKKEGRFYKLSWTMLKDIKVGDLIAVVGRIPDNGKSHKIFFKPGEKGKTISWPSETTEELLWLIGFYLGDGYMEGDKRINFAVPKDDVSSEKVEKLLRDLFNVKPTRRGVVLRVNSVNLVRFFTSLGLAGKARGKRIPGWVFKLPHQQKKALIDGYIAADGYKRDGHRNISVCSSNKKLLEDLKTLAISCGLNPLKISRWRRRERKPLGKKLMTYTHYFLYFSDIIPDSEIYFVPVKSIEPAGTKVTYDIEVDGTANFIAQGLIVHNSKVTMKYPSVYLLGRGAKADILSVAFAGRGQHQDTGAKAVHLAPDTTSRITSKSVCKDGGRTSYRGLLHVAKGAKRVKSSVRCDALILDDISRTDTYPYNDINEEDTTATHEATVGKIGEEQLFYLMSRGLSEQEALNMIVLGFLEPFTKTLPMEYAVEFNRLIELEMSGSVG